MLTERLEKVKNLVENSEITADVGTDHGYVPILLIKEKRAKHVIASDVNQGPLDSAKRNLFKYGVSDKTETRLGSGLLTLKQNEADTVIIAGMGGVLMADLLEEGKEIAKTIKSFVLQPMNSQDYLRKYLIENGYIIEFECLAREREKIYNILKVKRGESAPFEKEIYYHIGENFKFTDEELLNYYLTKKHNHYSSVIKNLENASREVDKQLEEYRLLEREIEEVMKKRGINL